VLAPNPDIEATIQSQFDAFLDRDVGEAWQYASPNIQSLFGTPRISDAWSARATHGLDPGSGRVHRPADAGQIIVQRVEVIDQAGTAHYLGYQMIRTENGWRINGVQSCARRRSGRDRTLRPLTVP
jgi:hypothetical protein